MKQVAIIGIAGAAFAAMPPNMLSDGPAKLLMPFLGLFMAGIFPAISLTINSVKSGGFSVKRITDLSSELYRLLDYLQLLFLAALIAALALLTGEILDWGHNFIFSFYTARVFNIVIGICLGALFSSLPVIRGTFRIMLTISTDIATDEAASKVRDKAAKLTPVSSRFPVKNDFGAVRNLPNESTDSEPGK